MTQIVQVTNNAYNDNVRELITEYFQWVNKRVGEDFGISFDIDAIIDQDLKGIDIYLPPHGGLFLAELDENYAGITCLKALREGVGEIKRMYVRPQYRRKGLGRLLLEAALEQARKIGYVRVLLDSPRTWKEAHALYISEGFDEIEEYPESQVPADFRENWIFMELQL